MAETEKLAEHDPGEPGRNTDNTEQGVGIFNGGSFSLELELGEVSSILCTWIFTEKGVGVLPLWFFLSGVRTQRS